MTTYDMTDFAAQVDGVLRPLGICLLYTSDAADD